MESVHVVRRRFAQVCGERLCAEEVLAVPQRVDGRLVHGLTSPVRLLLQHLA